MRLCSGAPLTPRTYPLPPANYGMKLFAPPKNTVRRIPNPSVLWSLDFWRLSLFHAFSLIILVVRKLLPNGKFRPEFDSSLQRAKGQCQRPFSKGKFTKKEHGHEMCPIWPENLLSPEGGIWTTKGALWAKEFVNGMWNEIVVHIEYILSQLLDAAYSFQWFLK